MLICLIEEVQRTDDELCMKQQVIMIKGCRMIVEDEKKVIDSKGTFSFCGNCFDMFTVSNAAMN